MSYTLIMTWDIKAGMEQEYFEFVVREWVPVTSKLGLKMVAVWFTHYAADSTLPAIRAEGITDDLSTMRSTLESPEWDGIQEQLMNYAENYRQKVVRTTGEFQI